jgi:hypothetical protein
MSLFLCTTLASAGLSAEEVARLGADLTPMGAEKAGNADGTIPAWEGGITKPPAGWKVGMKYTNPFSEDKPLFTITAENMDQHADKLSEGHKALLKAYPSFKMPIYPTHRSASFAQEVYDGTRNNTATAALVADGNGLTGALGGIPFPIPKSGIEVLWNGIMRPLGTGWDLRKYSIVAVTRGGDYTFTQAQDSAMVPFYTPGITEQEMGNILWKFRQVLTAPPRVAGRVLLLHETINQAQEPRKAWMYNPGQRRVRRAPEYAFDNPWAGSDGLMTIDQNNGFNGSPERYAWKLLGKREIYVPYNAYQLIDGSLKNDDILKPLHPNPEALRYELHRVWVVEGTLKDGQRHLYKRRILYVDEDSWNPVLTDLYDNRDQLWRFGEIHTVNYYDVPWVFYATEFHLDLQAGRYAAAFLNAEEPAWIMKVQKFTEKDFTTQALRRMGRR